MLEADELLDKIGNFFIIQVISVSCAVYIIENGVVRKNFWRVFSSHGMMRTDISASL